MLDKASEPVISAIKVVRNEILEWVRRRLDEIASRTHARIPATSTALAVDWDWAQSCIGHRAETSISRTKSSEKALFY